MKEKSVMSMAKAKGDIFELIQHPHHYARDFTYAKSRILHKCLFNREYLKIHAVDLFNDRFLIVKDGKCH